MLGAEHSIFTGVKTWKRRDPDQPPTPQGRWNADNHHKLAAHAAVRKALKTGELKRGRCKCGSLRVEAHHPDYSKALEVIWRCRACHQRLHAALRRRAAA